MELVVIGLYDDLTHAQGAKNELIASGFTRRDVQLNPDHDLSATGGASVPKGSGTVSGTIENFFQSLIVGDKSSYSNVYADAVRRGQYVLTVDVYSDERRRLAEEVMRHHEPAGIDERSVDWVRHGWIGHNPQAAKKRP
jgi:hypothetical protein